MNAGALLQAEPGGLPEDVEQAIQVLCCNEHSERTTIHPSHVLACMPRVHVCISAFTVGEVLCRAAVNSRTAPHGQRTSAQRPGDSKSYDRLLLMYWFQSLA